MIGSFLAAAQHVAGVDPEPGLVGLSEIGIINLIEYSMGHGFILSA